MKSLYRLVATILLIGAVGCATGEVDEEGKQERLDDKLQKTFIDTSVNDGYIVGYYTGNVSTVSSEFYFDMLDYQLVMNQQRRELVLQSESIDNYMKISYSKNANALSTLGTECVIVVDYKKDGLPKTATLNTKVVRFANGYAWLWDTKSKKGVVMPLSTNIR